VSEALLDSSFLPARRQGQRTSAGRTACVLLAFRYPQILRSTLEALRLHEPGLDLYVLHNPHPSTRVAFEQELRQLVAAGSISGAALFDENVNANAVAHFAATDFFEIRSRYDHLILSDGDICVETPFLEQALRALEKPDVASTSVRLDIRSLDVAVPGYESILKYTARYLTSPYDDSIRAFRSGSGIWMRCFRSDLFFEAAWAMYRNGFRFQDSLVDQFISQYWQADTFVLSDTCAREETRSSGCYSKEYIVEKKRGLLDRVKTREFHTIYNNDSFSPACVVLGSGEFESSVPKVIPSSPIKHLSLYDHPFFERIAGDVDCCHLVESYADFCALRKSGCIPLSRSSRPPLVFLAASACRRVYFCKRDNVFFAPLSLLPSLRQAKALRLIASHRLLKLRAQFNGICRMLASINSQQIHYCLRLFDHAAACRVYADVAVDQPGQAPDASPIEPPPLVFTPEPKNQRNDGQSERSMLRQNIADYAEIDEAGIVAYAARWGFQVDQRSQLDPLTIELVLIRAKPGEVQKSSGLDSGS